MKFFKRGLIFSLCLLMVCAMIPTGIIGTNAYGVSNYCATAAAQWGKKHVQDYDSILLGTGYWDDGGDCANFVSQCLYMGGIDMSGYWNTNGYKCHWSAPYGNSYAGSFIRCQQLYNFLVNKGATAKKNPSASEVSIGDVILFYKPDKGRYGHSCIVIDKVNGVPVVAAHSVVGVKYTSADPGYNNDWHLGFSGSNTTLMKMNGTLCVNNNPRSFDVYTAGSNAGLYSSASTSSSKLTTFLSGEYAHIFKTTTSGGATWGYTFRYGNWGWVKLSQMNYKRHIQSDPIDHIWGAWKVVKVANCKQNGLSERYCQRCGLRDTKTTTGGHITDPHAWCTTDGFCKICGAKTENALGHNWNGGEITTAPTCLETGIKTFTCQRDSSHKYTVVVPALGHDYIPGATAPTCTQDGIKTYKCSRCNDAYVAYINANNTWSDWMEDASFASTLPANKVQTKTQYRYRDKETKVQATSPGSGWTQNGVNKVETSYGSWSAWGTTAITASSTLDVGTAKVFRYACFSCSNCGTRVPVWGSSYKCPGCSKTGTVKEGSWDCIWHTTAYKDSGYVSGTYGGQYKSYTTSLGDGKKWYFSTGNKNDTALGTKDTDSSAVVITTGYRSRTITNTNIYNWYRWKSWSAWSDTKYTANDNRQVQTRKMYRYDLAALGHNFTIDTDKAFIQQDKLLSQAEAEGNCYSRGKLCSRCGAVSPDSTYVTHKFTTWQSYNGSETEQISYCDNGCGCYVIKADHIHTWTKQNTVAPTCNGLSGEQGYTVYKCSCGETMMADYTAALEDDYLNSVWEITQPATCTQSGERVRKCLRYDACGHTQIEEIPALGHTMTKFEAKERTCLVDGNTEYYYCSTCEKYFSDEEGDNEIAENSWVIEATGHTSGDWIVEHENGCGVTGWECRYCANEWCDEKIVCEVHGSHNFLMDEREIPEIVPDYYVVRAENAEYNESTGEWVATSCCADGIIYETCRNCEGTDHAHSWLPDVIEAPTVIDALEHDWGDYIVNEASCVHPGSKYKECRRCTTENCERCVYEAEFIDPPASEHSYEIAETIASPCSAGTPMNLYVCSICGQTECDECEDKGTPHYYWDGNPADHDMVLDAENSYPATCTENGLLHYVCQNCEYFNDEVIPALGHKMQLKETVDPTCVEDGYDIYKCSRCDHTEKENAVERLGHLESSRYVVTTKGSCVTDGLEEKLCERVCRGEVCNAKLDDRIIPSRKHNMGEWYDVWDSDDSNPQCRKRDCLNTDETDKYTACDYTETENHIWSEWVYNGADAKTHTKTCQVDNNETVTASCTFTSEVTKKATCTEDGIRTFTCTVCSGQYTTVIPAREHKWSYWHRTVEPELQKEGTDQRECLNTEETEEYEACTAVETRPVEVTGANYRVIINEMAVNGEYSAISDNTYCDLIGTTARAEYTVRPGFTFNAETSNAEGTITRDGDLVLNVYIDRNKYKLSFDDGTDYTAEDIYYQSPISVPSNPEKEGYTFKGWSEDGKTVIPVEEIMPNRDVAYKAVWAVNPYTVTYNFDGGREIVTYDFGSDINTYTPPEKEGYTFTGWDNAVPDKMPARNLEFNAEYQINTYTITYILAEKQYTEKTYNYNAEVTPVVPEAKTGYNFSGWSPEEPVYMPAENLILTGEWLPASGVEYKIETYLKNLEGEYDLYKEETKTGTTGEPVTADYTEPEGFHLDADISTLSGNIAPDGSLVLKVYIERNMHKIVFDPANGEPAIERNIYYQAPLVSPDKPEKEGYTFMGWSEDGETPVIVPETVPDRDITYVAVWKINKYTITFRYGLINSNTVYSESSLDYNSPITIPVDPSFTGYTFSSWDIDIPETMPAEDITVTALWNVNRYKITYIVEELSSVTEDEYNYGETIVRPENPSIKGKSFIGWGGEIPTTMPAEDLVFKAEFNPIIHYATFLEPADSGTYTFDGETYNLVDEIPFEEGAPSLSEPTVPEKEGFNGSWSEYPIPLPDCDITIVANYTPTNTDNTDVVEVNKTAEEKEDGIVSITLDAFSKAQNVIVKENAPVDIVLVVDQSGSMAYEMGRDVEARNGKPSRKDNLIKTANSFINSVKQNAEETGADHRISVVGFAMGSNSQSGFSAYQNTAVLTTKNDRPVQYNSRNCNTDVYKNSLMSIKTDFSHISYAVNHITTGGATAADLGFDMASRVFSANESDRKKIVVFITDGYPNHQSGFDSNVANSVINYAKALKNKNTTIYSIAIYNDADPSSDPATQNPNENKFNRFLHAVSSNYPSASDYSHLGEGDYRNGYYVNAANGDDLEKIFKDIYVRSVSKKVSFNSVTLYDTITPAFTMTDLQEEKLRNDLKTEYGISGADITVERKEDGTTYVEIRNLTPKKRYVDNTILWGVKVSFDVTVNESSLNAGEYTTNTEDAGVEVGNLPAATFTPANVTLSTDKYIVEYYLDGSIYDIQVYNLGDPIVPPEANNATWDLGENAVVTDRCAKFTASLGDKTGTVTWEIDGEIFTETYTVGTKINIPYDKLEGLDLVRWNPDVDLYMGDFSRTYYAVLKNHTHNFRDPIITGICTEGRTRTTTCPCGAKQEETLEPCEHVLEATIHHTETETITHFRCLNCNYNYEKVLTYKAKTDINGDLYDLNLFEDVGGAELHEDGDVEYLYVRIPVFSINDECAEKIAAGDKIYVYHIADNGLEELCDYHIDGDFIVIHCKSFSYYLISPRLSSGTSSAEEAYCILNGHKFEKKADKEFHWEECSTCGKVINKEEHLDKDADVVCDKCGRDISDSAEIKIPADTISLYFKETADLCAKTNRGKLVYSSSNEKVATVDEKGVITATGRGTCTITATIEGTDISESRHVRVDYSWWQWIHWMLLGCVWYFKTFDLGNVFDYLNFGLFR